MIAYCLYFLIPVLFSKEIQLEQQQNEQNQIIKDSQKECPQEYTFFESLQRCKIQLCDEYQYFNEWDNKCTSICNQDQYPNEQSKKCENANNCSYKIIQETNQDNERIQSIHQIDKKYFLIIYESFFTIVERNTGYLKQKIYYKQNTLQVQYLDNQLFMLRQQELIILNLMTLEEHLFLRIQQGIIMFTSRIYIVNKDYAGIDCYDTLQNQIYFSIFERIQVKTFSLFQSNQQKEKVIKLQFKESSFLYILGQIVVVISQSDIKIFKFIADKKNNVFMKQQINQSSCNLIDNIVLTKQIICYGYQDQIIYQNILEDQEDFQTQYNSLTQNYSQPLQYIFYFLFYNSTNLIKINSQEYECSLIKIDTEIHISKIKLIDLSKARKFKALAIFNEELLILHSAQDFTKLETFQFVNDEIKDIIQLQDEMICILTNNFIKVYQLIYLSRSKLSFIKKQILPIFISNPLHIRIINNFNDNFQSLYVYNTSYQLLQFQKHNQQLKVFQIGIKLEYSFFSSNKGIADISVDEMNQLIYVGYQNGQIIVWERTSDLKLKYYIHYNIDMNILLEKEFQQNQDIESQGNLSLSTKDISQTPNNIQNSQTNQVKGVNIDHSITKFSDKVAKLQKIVLFQSVILINQLADRFVLFRIDKEDEIVQYKFKDLSNNANNKFEVSNQNIVILIEKCIYILNNLLQEVLKDCRFQNKIDIFIDNQSNLYIQQESNLFRYSIKNHLQLISNYALKKPLVYLSVIKQDQIKATQITIFYDDSSLEILNQDLSIAHIIKLEFQVLEVIHLSFFFEKNQSQRYFVIFDSQKEEENCTLIINFQLNETNSSKVKVDLIHQEKKITKVFLVEQQKLGIEGQQYNQFLYKFQFETILSNINQINSIEWRSDNIRVVYLQQEFLAKDFIFILNNELIFIDQQKGVMGTKKFNKIKQSQIANLQKKEICKIQQVVYSIPLNRLFLVKYNDQEQNNRDKQNQDGCSYGKGFQVFENIQSYAYFNNQTFFFSSKIEQQMKNHQQEINLGIVQNYHFVEDRQQFFIYGSKLTIWSSNLNLITEIISEQPSQLIEQCIFTKEYFICLVGDRNIQVQRYTDYQIVSNIYLFEKPISFKYDGEYSNLLVNNDNQVFVYSIINSKQIGKLDKDTSKILEIALIKNKILILASGSCFIYQRESLVLENKMYCPASDRIINILYIKQLFYLMYLYDSKEEGYIYTYTSKKIPIKPIQSISNDKCIQIIQMKYINDYQKLIYADILGNVFIMSIPQMNVILQIRNIQFLNNPLNNFFYEQISQNIFLFNQKLVYKTDISQALQRMTSYYTPILDRYVKQKQSLQQEVNLLFLDDQEIIYQYKSKLIQYKYSFQKKIIAFKYIEQLNIIIACFSETLLVYLDVTDFNQLDFNSYSYQITDYKFIKFIEDDIFMTKNNQVIHYDFLKNKKIFQIQLNGRLFYYQLIYQNAIRVLISNQIIHLYSKQKVKCTSISLNRNIKFKVKEVYFSKFSNQLWLIWEDGIIQFYYFSYQELYLQKQVNLSDTIGQFVFDSSQVKINQFLVDEQNNRAFVRWVYSSYFVILRLYDLELEQFTHVLPAFNIYQNTAKLYENFIVIQSINEFIVYQRIHLSFITHFNKNTKDKQIIDLKIIQDKIFIISYTDSIQVLYLQLNVNDQQQENLGYKFKKINEEQIQFPEIIDINLNNNTSQLSIVGISYRRIFELFYNIQYEIGDQQACKFIFNEISSNDKALNEMIEILPPSDNYKKQFVIYRVQNDLDHLNYLFDKFRSSSIIFYSSENMKKRELNLNVNSFQQIKYKFYLKSFDLIFNQEGVYKFNENISEVILKDISITQQKKNIILLFENIQLVIIEDLKLSFLNNKKIFQNEKSVKKLKIQFINCQKVLLNGIQMKNSSLQQKNGSIMQFVDIKFLKIKDILIENSNLTNFMLFENIETLQIENGIIQNNESFRTIYNQEQILFNIFEARGCLNTSFHNILAHNNTNIRVLTIEKTLLQNDKETKLMRDKIIIKNLTAVNNKIITKGEEYLLKADKIPLYSYPISRPLQKMPNKSTHEQELEDHLDNQNKNHNMINMDHKQNNNIKDQNKQQNSLFHIESSFVIIQDTKFTQNHQNIVILNSNKLEILSSSFLNNCNFIGGSIYVNAFIIYIKNSRFQGNLAESSGGALLCENVRHIIFDEQSFVVDNSALIGGGIRFIYDQQQKIEIHKSLKKQVINNKASIFGDNIATYPKDYTIRLLKPKLEFKYKKLNPNEGNYDAEINIENFQSGDDISFEIEFFEDREQKIKFKNQMIIDSLYPQIIIDEIKQWNILIKNKQQSQIQLIGQIQINYLQFNDLSQAFRFQNINIISNPLTRQEIILAIDFGNYFKKKIKMFIEFRNCKSGEVLKKYTDNISYCYLCQDGKYFFPQPEQKQDSIQECKTCPIEAQICSQNQLILKKGYWRESQQSDYILECSFNMDSCDETSNNQNGCIQGYIGPLCESCDFSGKFWIERYTNCKNSLCCQCGSLIFQYIAIILTSLGKFQFKQSQVKIKFLKKLKGLFGYLIFQMRIFQIQYQKLIICHYLRLMNMLPISASSYLNKDTFYTKCLMNYFQIFVALNTFQPHPTQITYYPKFYGTPGVSLSYDISCIIPSSIIDNFGIGRVKMVTQTLIPIGTMILFIIIIYSIKKLKASSLIKRSFLSYPQLNFIWIFFQSDIINQLTKFFTCRKIGMKRYFSYDLLIECSDFGYRLFMYYYCIPIFIFYSLYPASVLFFLYKSKNKLNMSTTLYRYGYYYTDYKQTRFYWEFVRIYLRVLIILLFIFEVGSNHMSHMITILVFSFYILFIYKLQPFLNQDMQKTEIFSCLTLICLIILQNLQNSTGVDFFRITFAIIHFQFIIVIISMAIYYKIMTKDNIFGKLFLFLLKKICSTITYRRINRQFKTQFKTFKYWKSIRERLGELSVLDAKIKLQKYDSLDLKDNFLNMNKIDLNDSQLHFIQDQRIVTLKEIDSKLGSNANIKFCISQIFMSNKIQQNDKTCKKRKRLKIESNQLEGSSSTYNVHTEERSKNRISLPQFQNSQERKNFLLHNQSKN